MRKEIRECWETALSAQDVALEALEPGASASTIYERAERALRGGGLRGFALSIGSGIALEAYEPPRIGKGSDEMLLEGMVVTLDVRYLILGSYGVEVEDVYQITGNGAEPLTRTSRELYLL